MFKMKEKKHSIFSGKQSISCPWNKPTWSKKLKRLVSNSRIIPKKKKEKCELRVYYLNFRSFDNHNSNNKLTPNWRSNIRKSEDSNQFINRNHVIKKNIILCRFYKQLERQSNSLLLTRKNSVNSRKSSFYFRKRWKFF